MSNKILTKISPTIDANLIKNDLSFFAKSINELICKSKFCPNDFVVIINGKTTLGESTVDTIAFGNSFRNDKSIFISKGNHPGFLVKTSVKLDASSILFELFLPSTKIRLFNAFVILSESTGNLTVSHSSNSTTPSLISETLESIKRKSMSVNSKKDSSTLSFSDNFAIPDTSISLVLSKHNPNIL